MSSRLLKWLPAAVAPVVVAGAVTVPLVAAAAPPALPDKTPQQVLEMIAKAKTIDGFSGRIEQTSDLGLPSLPTTGAGSDSDTASTLNLLTGTHEADVWAAGSTRTRVAVLDDMAERDVYRDGSTVWLWDSKKNRAVKLEGSGAAEQPEGTTMTPAQIAEDLLQRVGPTTATTVDTTQRVAGRDAYTLVLTPKTDATTVGSVRLAVDGTTGLPLQVAVLARGASSPAFESGFTSIDYAVPAESNFTFTPPKDATVTTKRVGGSHSGSHRSPTGERPEVVGSGWSAVVELPAGSAPASIESNPTYQRLTTEVAGGRVLSTSLVNVLRTDDGRVLAGAVPVERLQAVAAR
ncbi:LolA family protein [Amnibacterium endophyticum]|uniref:Outer membrane lipoprotein carrier protein LolA n=1 Tax=Amnibacterium endophyticum TaxID=2109337 RepID=A0ABW4LBT5_9MICO